MRDSINIELFPCSGGMALGFRRAGIEFDMAIDFDPCAIASYEANLGHRPLQMDVRDFLRLLQAGWRPAKRIGLLVADPPCTPWSRAGKRKGQADERDMLAETMAIIELLMPERWVIANMPGLDDSSHWDKVVKPVIGATAVRLGYCVDYASLNAAKLRRAADAGASVLVCPQGRYRVHPLAGADARRSEKDGVDDAAGRRGPRAMGDVSGCAIAPAARRAR